MLKGLPLRELVETFFESVAGGGVGGANGGASAPHAELTALAVRHVPDLLHAFSEVCEKRLWGIRSFSVCSKRCRLVWSTAPKSTVLGQTVDVGVALAPLHCRRVVPSRPS